MSPAFVQRSTSKACAPPTPKASMTCSTRMGFGCASSADVLIERFNSDSAVLVLSYVCRPIMFQLIVSLHAAQKRNRMANPLLARIKEQQLSFATTSYLGASAISNSAECSQTLHRIVPRTRRPDGV